MATDTFKAVLRNGDAFKAVLNTICVGLETENFTLTATTEGLAGKAMDSSRISCFEFNFFADGFDEYECNGNFKFGLNAAVLSKAFAVSESGNQLVMISNPDPSLSQISVPESIQFIFSNDECTYDLVQKCVDIDEEDFDDFEDPSYECTVNLPTSEFCRMTRDLSNLGSSVTVKCKKSHLLMETDGANSIKGSVKIVPRAVSSAEDVTIHCNSEQNMSFALRYLKSFSIAQSLCPRVKMKMTDKRPLVVDYQFKNDEGFVKFYLAPQLAR